ncbi:hypothetical protein SCYAM73S_07454 [Streptomyces cyaneofuscatus]
MRVEGSRVPHIARPLRPAPPPRAGVVVPAFREDTPACSVVIVLRASTAGHRGRRRRPRGHRGSGARRHPARPSRHPRRGARRHVLPGRPRQDRHRAQEPRCTPIISDQTKLSYSQVWDALKATDEDPANSSNVILLYTGRSQSKNDNGGNADRWNREHVWAKSHGDFGTAAGPGHRRPPSAPRGRLGQLRPRQQGLRQRRQPAGRGARQLHRRRLLRTARRGQGRRRPHDPLHGGALRGQPTPSPTSNPTTR